MLLFSRSLLFACTMDNDTETYPRIVIESFSPEKLDPTVDTYLELRD